MQEIIGGKKQTVLSPTWLFAVVGFSAAAFLVRWAGLAIPVIGTTINSDPREIFVTLGAAVTGPIGGLMIGFFSGLPVISMALSPSSIIAHGLSGLLIGLLYKPVHNRGRMPVLLLGWVVLIAAYYYIFLIPFFMAAGLLIAPQGMSDLFGEGLPLSQIYSGLGQAACPEAVVTCIITTILLIALPEKYRRPLW